MRHLKNTICFLLVLTVLGACKKKDDKYSTDDIYPRIFDNSNAFASPSRIVGAGEAVEYKGLKFSPSPFGKAKIKWLVNGQEVSNDTTFTFTTPLTGGEFVIRLELIHNGDTAYRKSNILVSPDSYTPKPYNNIIMGYASAEARGLDIDWGKFTHVTFKGARIGADGGLDLSAANAGNKMDEMVARAHSSSIPLLLGVSGSISETNGWTIWGSNYFGEAITDPAIRATIVQNLANYVIAKKADGIDLLMTDLNGVDHVANINATIAMLNELRPLLPANSILTISVPTNWVASAYGNLSAADWVNVHAYDDGNLVSPGLPMAQISSFNYMKDKIDTWVNLGVPKNKIVVGIPAFGIKYTDLDAQGNILNWDAYSYIKYKDIIRADAGAKDLEFTDKIAKGVYLNGVPLVTQKANHVKDNGYKGVYVWCPDYDTQDNSSVVKAIYEVLK